jgi:hypothetical protein
MKKNNNYVRSNASNAISEYSYNNKLKKYIVNEHAYSKQDFEANFTKLAKKSENATEKTEASQIEQTATVDSDKTATATVFNLLDKLQSIFTDRFTFKSRHNGFKMNIDDKSVCEFYYNKKTATIKVYSHKSQFESFQLDVEYKLTENDTVYQFTISNSDFDKLLATMRDNVIASKNKSDEEKAQKQADKKAKKSEKTEKTDSDTTTSDTDVQIDTQETA